MRGRGRTLLLAICIVGLGAACGGGDASESQPRGQSSTSSTIAESAGGSGDARRDAIAAGVMPDLTGAGSLDELGDQSGVLYELHDVIGPQETVHVPSDDVPEGAVIAQDPPPGTPLTDVAQWSLTVSQGGPVVAFDSLPAEVAEFASTLDGLDDESVFVERTTEHGVVYKHDDWLLGLDCDAVEAAYRTFSDGRYATACPGFVDPLHGGID